MSTKSNSQQDKAKHLFWFIFVFVTKEKATVKLIQEQFMDGVSFKGMQRND